MRGAFHIVMILGWIVLGTHAARAEIDARDFRRARDHYEHGDYLKTVEMLREAGPGQPGYAEARRLMGHALYELGRIDEARESLADAVAHGLLTPDVLARLARIDRQRNRTGALLPALQLRMLIDPEDNAWALLYADILASSGLADQAERIYQDVIDSVPNSPEAYVRLGNLHLAANEHDRALPALETAFYLGVSDTGLSETIAELWFRAGDRRQALLWYERALKMQANPPDRLLLRRAELLFWSGELAGSESAAQSLLGSEDGETKGKTLLLLGQIAVKRDRPEEAARYWEQAVREGLNEPQILVFLGSHYFNSGQFDDAARHLSARIDAGPKDKTLLRHLISALIRAGRTDRARASLETYLELYDSDGELERLVRELVAEEMKTDRT